MNMEEREVAQREMSWQEIKTDGREVGDDDEGRETEEQRKMGGEEEERQKLETEYGAKAGRNWVRERWRERKWREMGEGKWGRDRWDNRVVRGKRKLGRGVEEGEKWRREGSKNGDERERYRKRQIGPFQSEERWRRNKRQRREDRNPMALLGVLLPGYPWGPWHPCIHEFTTRFELILTLATKSGKHSDALYQIQTYLQTLLTELCSRTPRWTGGFTNHYKAQLLLESIHTSNTWRKYNFLSSAWREHVKIFISLVSGYQKPIFCQKYKRNYLDVKSSI